MKASGCVLFTRGSIAADRLLRAFPLSVPFDWACWRRSGLFWVAGCRPSGFCARNSAGNALSCQKSVWRTALRRRRCRKHFAIRGRNPHKLRRSQARDWVYSPSSVGRVLKPHRENCDPSGSGRSRHRCLPLRPAVADEEQRRRQPWIPPQIARVRNWLRLRRLNADRESACRMTSARMSPDFAKAAKGIYTCREPLRENGDEQIALTVLPRWAEFEPCQHYHCWRQPASRPRVKT